MEPRVAAYLRVSTENQTHDSQEMEIQDYCTRRGYNKVRWFKDTASGAKQDRQGLADLMQNVRQGKVDIVVAYKLDRMARSLSHLAQIIAELQAHGVALICPSQGIDTTSGNPAATLQLNILGAVAQFEKDLTVERVRSGILAAKNRGVKFGRPSKSEARKKQILALMNEGLNTRAISEELNIPYSTTTELIRELKNPSL